MMHQLQFARSAHPPICPLHQVLIPLVPEETGGCGWLQAQADVLAGLVRLAQQPGAAVLPHAAARAAEEFLEAAKQRLRAEQAAAAAAGGGQAAAVSPAAPLTNLQKGQALVAAMLRVSLVVGTSAACRCAGLAIKTAVVLQDAMHSILYLLSRAYHHPATCVVSSVRRSTRTVAASCGLAPSTRCKLRQAMPLL